MNAKHRLPTRAFCLALLCPFVGAFCSADGVVDKPKLPNFDTLAPVIKEVSAIKRIQHLFEKKKYEQAIEVLKNTEEQLGKTGETKFALGIVRQATGQHEEAIVAFSEAILMDFGGSLPYAYRGLSNFANGKHDQALKDFSAGIALEPESPLCFHQRAYFYYYTGDVRAAREELDTVIHLQPNPACFEMRAVCNYELGDNEAAVRDASSALKAAPKKTHILLLRAVANAGVGKLDDALNDFDTVAECAPEPNVYIGRGMIHFKRGNYTAASSEASSAIELDPTFAPAYRLRAAADIEVFKRLEAQQHQQVADSAELIR